MKKYICFSGGAEGADYVFEKECNRFKIKVIAYSFLGHHSNSKNQKILNVHELDGGWQHILIANKSLNRNLNQISFYAKCLLSRNWYQVRDSDLICAIGTINSNEKVDGGTGWAVQMGIDNNKEIFVFDQSNDYWHVYDYESNRFVESDSPVLPTNFTGIGTRKINRAGIQAIVDLMEQNFEKDD